MLGQMEMGDSAAEEEQFRFPPGFLFFFFFFFLFLFWRGGVEWGKMSGWVSVGGGVGVGLVLVEPVEPGSCIRRRLAVGC